MTGSSAAIQEIAQLLERLVAQHTTLKAEVEALEQRISAVQTTLRLLDGETEAPALSGERPPPQPSLDVPVIRPKPVSEWVRLLRGLKQMDALLRIAQESGGMLRTSEAARILVSTGLAKGKARNVNSHIYHMVQDSDQFERVAPGTFQIVAPHHSDLNGRLPFDIAP